MRREDVLTCLRLVGLGLSGDADGESGRFMFRGGRVYAHNGIYGLYAELDIGTEASLPGDKLMKLLSSCDDDEVTFTRIGDSVRVTSGRTKVNMQVMDVAGVCVPDEVGVVVDWVPAWTTAIARCAWSVSDDPQRPDLSGVTMHATESSMNFYSTTGIGLTKCIVPGEVEPCLVGGAVIIPSPYVQVMQKIVAVKPCVAVRFGDDCLHMIFGDGGWAVHLYGDFIANAVADRYEETLAQTSEGLTWMPIPVGFASALGRVEAAGGVAAHTEFSHDGANRLSMHTVCDFGDITDELACPTVVESCVVKAALLRQSAAIADAIAFSSDCVGLHKGPEFAYYQATVTEVTNAVGT